PELLERYFEPSNQHHVVQKDLRRAVIFGRHDLIQDAPISRVDLLICRNTLMYFNAETQAKIIDRFHFALSDKGFLFLGKAETLLTYTRGFAAVDRKRGLFARVPRGVDRERYVFALRGNGNEPIAPSLNQARLREAAFDAVPVALIVTDANNVLT